MGPVVVVIEGAPRQDAPLGASTLSRATMEIEVGAKSYPFIDSHRVNGVAVVPVVLAIEWFARAAKRRRPDLELASCRNVRVLKGIRLAGFGEHEERFTITSREVGNGSGSVQDLELIGPSGTVHYTARAEMVAIGGRPEATTVQAPTQLGESPWSTDAIYDELLFHGPKFRVIREVLGIGDAESVAEVASTGDLGWESGPWSTDAAALDGGSAARHPARRPPARAHVSSDQHREPPALPLRVRRGIAPLPAEASVSRARIARSRT